MGRHRFLVAASIAGALIAAGPGAWAATPQRAEVRGVTDRALKALIQQVIGQAPAPTSRLEARRRANDAGEQVTAVLRSEGYYDAVVAPDIGDGDSPQPFVTVTLGPRTKIADLKIDYSGTAPDAASAQAAQTAMALKPRRPGARVRRGGGRGADRCGPAAARLRRRRG